jgi:hypothetical protein
VGRAGRIVAWLGGAVVLALVLAQAFLPSIAASRISSRVGRYGDVHGVSVSAWPAVKLLWGEADSVSVHAGSLSISPSQTAKLLWEASGVSSLTLSASSVREGPLALRNVSLRKRGRQIAGQGTMTSAAVTAALPPGLRLRLISSDGGQVTVRASGHSSFTGLLGANVSLDVLAGASDGELTARALGAALGGVHLTLFSSRYVYVQGVAVRALTGPAGSTSYLLSIGARLR